MALAAPTNLSAEVLSSTQLLLTWDEVPTATLHRVYKNGTIVDIANGSWVDDSFDPDAVTTYEVRGVLISFTGIQFEPEPTVEVGPAATLVIGDDDGETDVPTPPATLTVPASLAVTQTGLNEATLTWELLTPATNIDVEIDGVVTRIDAATSYVESGITTGDDRDYRIRAVNTEADPEVVSDYTSTVSITIVALGVPDPNTTVQSSTRILVDWAAIPGATAYDIEIDGAVTRLGDFTAALDAALDPQQTRTYRVRAVSGTTLGDWSAEVEATTFRTVPLVITAQPGRVSYFPSDARITNAALRAEFDNFYARVNGGTLTENTTDPAPAPEPIPLPTPEPPSPPPDPPPPDPPPPDPEPEPVPGPFPGAPSPTDPARPGSWLRETNPLAANTTRTILTWGDFFGTSGFPSTGSNDLRVRQNRYVALKFNSGTANSAGRIGFSDLSGAIAGVGTRPALVTISPYEGDFRLSLGTPYRLTSVGGISPSYRWTRTEADGNFQAYLPDNTDLYLNIAYVSTASQDGPAESLVWQSTALNPTQAGHRLQSFLDP